MTTRSIQIVTAAALAALAGQAIAQQHEQMTPSGARQISQKLEEASKSLTDAIQLAERETGGKALSAQILTANRIEEMYRRSGGGDAPGQLHDRDRPDNSDRDNQADPQRDNPDDRNPDDRNPGAEQNRDRLTTTQERGLHASVVCLVNETQLRRVIVDLEEGRVVQSRALGAGMGENPGALSAAGSAQMRLASDIINANAVTASGEDIGDIDDLALDVSTGQVRYAVLRTGGMLGMGGERHAAPLHALMFVGDEKVRINITEEQLKDRPGFDNDRWPQHPTAAWGEGRQAPGQDQQQQQPQAQRPGQPQMSSTVEKASDVIGATVQGAGEASVGDVHDIVIKPSDSTIAHYIIATGDGKVAVPASKIRMNNRRLTLDMQQSEFERLPKFTDDENPDWTNPDWLRDAGDDDDRDARDEQNPDRGGG